MTNLLVIDVSVKSGRGHVVLAAGAHKKGASTRVTLEFPLDEEPDGPYPQREEVIVRDAKAILREANIALDER